MKKCMIWGAGSIGQSEVLIDILNLEYDIIGYYDGDAEKWGKSINKLQVFSQQDFQEKCKSGNIAIIFIAIANREIAMNIEKKLYADAFQIPVLNLFCRKFSDIEMKYLKNVHENMRFIWHVDFSDLTELWIENLMGELEFWTEQAKPENNNYLKNFLVNQFFSKYEDYSEINKFVYENAVVMDIGSGMVSKYGNVLTNGTKIKLVAVDSLSYYYNKLMPNREQEYKKIQFGILEFLADFYKKESADVILINNTLDHAIDPYRSLIECLFVLKQGGLIKLVHRRAEALFEKYTGLHRWNIDYNENGELLFWNNQNTINISKAVEKFAKIKVNCIDDSIIRENQIVTVEIIKTAAFNIDEYIDQEKECKDLATIISKLMSFFASENVNIIFAELLKKYDLA